MGNHQSSCGGINISLQLEKQQYVAGEVVRGRVYLAIASSATAADEENILERVDGVNLLLEGYEHVEINDKEHENSSTTNRGEGAFDGGDDDDSAQHESMFSWCKLAGLVEDQPIVPGAPLYQQRKKRPRRRTNVLLRIDYPIVKASQLEAGGRYEFPFEWKLPASLTNSIYCKRKRPLHSSAEIRYTMSAYVAMHEGILRDAVDRERRRRHPKYLIPQADTSICITSPSPSYDARPSDAMEVETEQYPIHNVHPAASLFCPLWIGSNHHHPAKKGNILLGWQTNTDAALPGETVTVHLMGENHCPVAVSGLSVKCVETVTWWWSSSSSKERQNPQQIKRIVGSARVSTESVPWWQPWYKKEAVTRHGQHNHHQHSLQTKLTLVADTRPSYSGQFLQVRHTIVVTAETRGLAYTNPDSACQFRVLSHLQTTADKHVDSAAIDNLELSLGPQSSALSTDSGPIVGETVMTDTCAWDNKVLAPSSESFETEATSDTSSIMSSFSDDPLLQQVSVTERILCNDSQEIRHLLALVEESPGKLEQALENDAKWATRVQNLSPREYGAVVSRAAAAATRSSHRGKHDFAPRIAQTLALIMQPRFQCRHVLACLRSLPSYTKLSSPTAALRMDILRRVAPLVSDLKWNENQLQLELTSAELAHFQILSQ